MEPGTFSDCLGKLPPFCQTFTGRRMVQPEDLPFDVADAGVMTLYTFRDAGVALRQTGVQCNLADIVQQSADKRLTSQTRSANQLPDRLGSARRRQAVLPYSLSSCGGPAVLIGC